MSAQKLYTPELLGLAVELAEHPLDEQGGAMLGDARSQSCGSTLSMSLVEGEGGAIETVGMRVRACAVGQGAAAIFARHAPGRDVAAIRAAHDELTQWLAGEGPAPDWPDLALIAPARDYPGRHGAILLPWKAALSALSSSSKPG